MLNRARGLFRFGPLERWLRDRTEGKPASSLWGRLMPPEYTYGKGSRRNITRDGLRYELDISNATDHGAYFGYADKGDDNLTPHIQPHHTVVDIGGNIGIRAMHFARLVPQGRVITFEPDPDNFARLLRHVSMNGFQNIVPRPYGIGPVEATHKLYQVVESNSGMNRIITHADNLERFSFKEVTVLPLSKGFEGLPVQRVDVIKVDVEGFEHAVLQGCEDVLRRDHPVLFIELDDDNLLENESSARGLIAWLERLGYTVRDAISNTPVPAQQDLAHCHFDILCVPAAGDAQSFGPLRNSSPNSRSLS